MSGHFPAVDCIFNPHPFFYESMPRFAHNRCSTVLFNYLDCVPDKSWIMDNSGSGISLEEFLSQKTHKIISLEKFTGFIEKEAPVSVTIPGNTEVSVII